jgi:hypothetical protein
VLTKTIKIFFQNNFFEFLLLSEGNQRGDFVPFNFSKNVSAPDLQAIKAGRGDRQTKKE